MKELVSTMFLFLLGITSVLQAQVGNAPSEGISDEQLFRTSIKELSDDSFGGRKPLSRHEDLTVDYIANQFKALGLQPVDGSYFQEVPMLSIKTNVKGDAITMKGKKGTVRFKMMDDIVLWTLRAEEKLKVSKAELVFVGFGINAPEYGWNDYEGIDVKGKIVVMLVNDPGFYDDNLFRGKNYMTYYGRWTYKYEEASRQGAAGALIIHETAAAAYNWSVVQNGRASDILSLYSPTGNKEQVALQGWITGEAAQKLFDIAGKPLDDALVAAKQKGFKSFPLGVSTTIETNNNIRIANSRNVVGVLPGTDLKDEYIVYSAHWDHLGIGAPIDGDSIYNGADDNASGVAALFVIANKFKQLPEPPRRSILFISVTGEESGLLGSAYYVAHPLFPLNKTVINLNMDSYGDKQRTSEVRASGGGLSKDVDRYVVEAAAIQGKPVRFSTTNPGGGFFRSDHFNFAKAGVPVVLAAGSKPLLPKSAESMLWGGKNTYHQPTDEYHEWWDVSGSLEDIYLYYGIGLRLANDGYFPKWDDATYKAARDAQECDYAIAVHGGAGSIAGMEDDAIRAAAFHAALDSALMIGNEILSAGGEGVKAVMTVISYLEDNPLFNAGKGATVTDEGTFELDAAIMQGQDLNAGAVAGVKTVKHPILAAYSVMINSPHVMLSGTGAEQFATGQGLEIVDNMYFSTPRTMEWIEELKSGKNGTVGCVVRDKQGNLAAGTSTGGMFRKKWGRIGDSPVIGAGTYADNRSCAVSCTGHGEYFIRHAVAYNLCARYIHLKETVGEAADHIIHHELNAQEGNGGLIAIDRDGHIAMPFNSGGMFRGFLYKEKGARTVVKATGIGKEMKQ